MSSSDYSSDSLSPQPPSRNPLRLLPLEANSIQLPISAESIGNNTSGAPHVEAEFADRSAKSTSEEDIQRWHANGLTVTTTVDNVLSENREGLGRSTVGTTCANSRLHLCISHTGRTVLDEAKEEEKCDIKHSERIREFPLLNRAPARSTIKDTAVDPKRQSSSLAETPPPAYLVDNLGNPSHQPIAASRRQQRPRNRNPLHRNRDMEESPGLVSFESSDSPHIFLQQTIGIYEQIFRNGHLIGPCTREMIEDLLTDCLTAEHRGVDLIRECTRLSANTVYISEQLLLDKKLKEKIEEYQLMRFHNYLLAMGKAIPETRECGLDFLKRVHTRIRFDGGKWEYAVSNIIRDAERLGLCESFQRIPTRPSDNEPEPVIEEDLSRPNIKVSDAVTKATPRRPKVNILDAVMEGAKRCGDRRWQWVVGPVVEYATRMQDRRKKTDIWLSLPKRQWYGSTFTLADLIEHGEWERISQRIVRYQQDLPYIVPIALRHKIHQFRCELKRWRDFHFKSLETKWSDQEQREVSAKYELQDWVKDITRRESSDIAEGALGTMAPDTYRDALADLSEKSRRAHDKWMDTWADMDLQEQAATIAEKELEKRRLLHQESEEELARVASKVRALEANMI